MRILSLPPTDLNIFLHVKCVHLQISPWKAADQLGPADVSMSEYGCEIKDGIGPIYTDLCINSSPPGRTLLINALLTNATSCHCCAEGKACKEANCICHRLNSPAPSIAIY